MRQSSMSRLSRRSFIGGVTALGATTTFTGFAAADDHEPSIWEQMARNRMVRDANDGDHNTKALDAIDSTEPMVSNNTTAYIEQAFRRYEQIVANGGWPEPTREMFNLQIGQERPAVEQLKRHLIITGDLSADARVDQTFDGPTDLALRTFQARHGLVISGRVREETWYAMAVPAERRLQQLRLNMQRIGMLAPEMPETCVLVNIPAALIEVTSQRMVHDRHTAVVGRIDRQTPILQSRIHEINFNPYWTVPKSIIRRDLIEYMNDDPQYLTNYNIRIFNGQGQELRPTDIDWTTDEAVQYTFRQDPGAENSMGHVKINFHNSHAVYLHDTPAKSLFGENRRFHSSGCVRVEDVKDLVAFVLRNNQGWDPNAIDAVFTSGERADVAVADPVTIQTTYLSAWTNSKGVVSFRDDIYEFDAQGIIDVTA